jgi:hypothetical protein
MKKLNPSNNYFYFNPHLQTKSTELTKYLSIEQAPVYSAEYVAELVDKGKSYNIQLANQEDLNTLHIQLLEALVDKIDTLAKRAISLDIHWDYSNYNPEGLREKIESFLALVGRNLLERDRYLKKDDELKASLIQEYRSFNLPELDFDDMSFINLYKVVRPYKIAYEKFQEQLCINDEELPTWDCEQYNFWVISKAREYNIPIPKQMFIEDKWAESTLFLKLRSQVEEMELLEYQADDWDINWDFTNYDVEGLRNAINDAETEAQERHNCELEGIDYEEYSNRCYEMSKLCYFPALRG